jgi:hypothetical protein
MGFLLFTASGLFRAVSLGEKFSEIVVPFMWRIHRYVSSFSSE